MFFSSNIRACLGSVLPLGYVPQDLVQTFMDIGRLGGSTLRQAGPHLGVKGLAQVCGRTPHAAAPAMNGATVGGGAQEVPQQREHLLLHHLGLARIELRHKFWK